MTIRPLLLAFVIVCLSQSVSPAADKIRTTIDQQIEAAWKENKVTPAPLASDSEFLRRVYLDLVGKTPSYEETLAFLDSTEADKREKLVEQLLADPRFGIHQSDLWDMVYFGRNPPGYGTSKRDEFKSWLSDQFNQNVSYRKWAGDILRAEGSTLEPGTPMYFVQYKNAPEDATQAITQQFLGVQLQCARCHDHPFEKWSQLDFYGIAAFLARLEVVDVGEKKLTSFAVGEKNLGDVLFTGPAAEQEVGQKGEPVTPTFLGGEVLNEPELPKDVKDPRLFPAGKMPPKPHFSRRDQLAEWITSPDNPFFARAVANRIWGQFMGKGIVDPVDNLSDNNPASHPELLDALAKSLVEHDFDLKWLIREIVNSKPYQLASSGPVEEAKPAWYERARYRPLSAEELVESWVEATDYEKVLAASGKEPKSRFDLGGPWVYMIKYFGEPNDGVDHFQGGIHEHFYMNNGELHQLISEGQGSLYATLSQSEEPWEKRIEKMYLSVLSRRPTPAETRRFAEHLQADDEPRERLKEAIWALLTCSEFRFNH
ncbi:DUF1549 and DUF1553 domain-containing protein [Lignipirellula cremea]|uniref:Cytochrome c domain-containing protein n=1 Tax=Lignipirellula cremea TaxID=2528010 RepID=A0A518DKV6_9BACT|nr:DUF1549 and DUF1553 domain-containing protein [Lignipirellula cremea]QDU92473.1 hypothetical protein Pla8534_02210 [Lignipirellula cremea]